MVVYDQVHACHPLGSKTFSANSRRALCAQALLFLVQADNDILITDGVWKPLPAGSGPGSGSDPDDITAWSSSSIILNSARVAFLYLHRRPRHVPLPRLGSTTTLIPKRTIHSQVFSLLHSTDSTCPHKFPTSQLLQRGLTSW